LNNTLHLCQTKNLLRDYFFEIIELQRVCVYLKEILRITDFVNIFLWVESVNYSEQAKNYSEDPNLPLTM